MPSDEYYILNEFCKVFRRLKLKRPQLKRSMCTEGENDSKILFWILDRLVI